MMTILTIAEAATPGGVDGMTLTVAGITALGIAVAAVAKAFKNGEAKGEAKRTVSIDGQPITFQATDQGATHDELFSLKNDMDIRLSKIEACLAEERAIARTALSRIHQRLDGNTVATAELKGGLDKVAENVDRLLALALNQNHRTPKPRA